MIYNNFLKAPTFTNLPRCGAVTQYCFRGNGSEPLPRKQYCVTAVCGGMRILVEFIHIFVHWYTGSDSGVAPGIFRREADSSDKGAKIWFSGYYKCQKSPTKSLSTFQRGASMLRRGGYSPLALPWRHPLSGLGTEQIVSRKRQKGMAQGNIGHALTTLSPCSPYF